MLRYPALSTGLSILAAFSVCGGIGATDWLIVMDAAPHFAASRTGGIAAQLGRASVANHHHPSLESVAPVDTSTGFERQKEARNDGIAIGAIAG